MLKYILIYTVQNKISISIIIEVFLVEKDDYYFVLQLFVSGWENAEQSGLDPENDQRLRKKELWGENFVCCQD